MCNFVHSGHTKSAEQFVPIIDIIIVIHLGVNDEQLNDVV